MFAVDGPSPEGPVRTGVFVAPRSLNCALSNPALIAPTSGTLTAFDEVGWSDDTVLEPEGGDRGDFSEGLRLCPGAEEFWSQPVWISDLFDLVATDEMEDVDGFETRLVSIVAASDDASNVEGTMWVTSDGWPVKVSIEATVVGGVERIIGSDDPSDRETDVQIEYALTDADAGALAVRAPDGTLLAGPIGPIETDVMALPPLEGRLLTVTNIAKGSLCRRENGVAAILGDYSVEDLELSKLSTSTVVIEADGTVSSSLHVGLPADIAPPLSTGAELEAAKTHALLYFRDIAPFVTLSDWVGFVPQAWEDPDSDRMQIPVLRRGSDGSSQEPLVLWDAETTVWSEPVSLFGGPEDSTQELISGLLLHTRDGGLAMSEDDDFAARAWMAPWIEAVTESLQTVPQADLQVLADLKALAEDLDRAVLVACARLGTYFAQAEDAIEADEGFDVILGIFADEISTQYLLLFLEYVQVLVDYLARPDVDWLQADGVDLETGLGAGTSDATFVQFLSTNALQLQELMTPEGMRDAVGL